MKKFDELMSVGSEIENITAEEAKQKLNDSNVQFIDVRDKESFSKGTIGNAIHMDRGLLEFYLAEGSPLENDIFKNKQWSCAAITLTHKYGLANPLDTSTKSYQGRSYNHPSGNCAVKMKSSKGVGAGDGEDDGEVTMVVCPRNPYCSSNAGKIKVMWWWDDKKMQDSVVIDPNL